MKNKISLSYFINYFKDLLDLLASLTYSDGDDDLNLITNDAKSIESYIKQLGIAFKIMEVSHFPGNNKTVFYANIAQKNKIKAILGMKKEIASLIEINEIDEINIIETGLHDFQIAIEVPLDRYIIGSEKYGGKKRKVKIVFKR